LLSGIVVTQGCGLLPPSAADVEIAHWNWPCEALGPIPGPEDIALDQRNGIAYVSSTDRFAVDGLAKPVIADGLLGRIYRIDLKVDPPRVDDVTPAADGRDFLPQGIDLLDDGTERRLFVVNRQRAPDGEVCGGGGEILILSVPNDASPMRRKKTVRDDRLTDPNDVAAVGGDAFHVTNSTTAETCVGQILGVLFARTGGRALYYDGDGFHDVAGMIEHANGIAADRTTRRLSAGSTIDGRIHSYVWKGEGSAQPDGSPPVAVGLHTDNLFRMPDGSLLAAAHPSLVRFFLYARGMVDTAGTRVLHIAPGTDGRQTVREIFADDGGQLSAGSSAVLYESEDGSRRRLLIGAVYADHLLVCKGDSRERL
jgi:hypothetical protein